MKTTFEIGNVSEDSTLLLLEIGDSFCVETYLSNKNVQAVRVHIYDTTDLQNSIQQILDKAVRYQALQRVVVSSAFPQSILVPRKTHQADSLLLKAVYGENHWHELTDAVNEWQVVNEYAIPIDLYKIVTSRFPDIEFTHVYSSALKIYNGYSSHQQIAAHFTANQFRVIVKKDQQLQLVQTYTYTSPMDVVYFLLKICTEFGMTQEDTQLVLSGFIEENSALYKELYNYFLNIHFANTSHVRLPEHSHPAHFFTSIHNLAACVL